MKKFPFFLLTLLALVVAATSCLDDDEKTLNKYADWYDANVKWYEEQAALTQDGKSYYTRVTAPWDPAAEVLIHWYNDTSKTHNNLKPLYSSMVDVKYHLSLYNGTAIDSSYLRTSPADSVYRCRLTSVVQGWAIALPRMHIGDSCCVVLPYNVGYGSTGSSGINPYSTLKFNIKLVGIYKYEQ